MIRVIMPVFDIAYHLVRNVNACTKPQMFDFPEVGIVYVRQLKNEGKSFLRFSHFQSWEGYNAKDTFLADYLDNFAKRSKLDKETKKQNSIYLQNENIRGVFMFSGGMLGISYTLDIDEAFQVPSSPLYKVIAQFVNTAESVKKYKETSDKIVSATSGMFDKYIAMLITVYL